MSFADTARDEYDRAGLDQEIKTLREQLASARKALEPFAKGIVTPDGIIVGLMREDVERARDALKDST